MTCIVTSQASSPGMGLRTVGDLGELPSSLPAFMLPQVPLTFESLKIIFPYSVTLATVRRPMPDHQAKPVSTAMATSGDGTALVRRGNR